MNNNKKVRELKKEARELELSNNINSNDNDIEQQMYEKEKEEEYQLSNGIDINNESNVENNSKINIRKELTKRLESNIARHRLSVFMNESTAKERLEKRLKERTQTKK